MRRTLSRLALLAAFLLGATVALRARRAVVIELLEAVGVIDLDDDVARHPAAGHHRDGADFVTALRAEIVAVEKRRLDELGTRALFIRGSEPV